MGIKTKKSIVFALNFIVALSLLVVYLSPYVNPSAYWWMGAIAYLYPTLICLNLCFLFYWGIQKNLFFALSFFMILVGYRHMTHTIAFDIFEDDVKAGGEFKLTSYNVGNFDMFNLVNDEDAERFFKQFFEQQQPDVICFQELFSLKSKDGYAYIDTIKKIGNYAYQYLHTQEEETRQYHGINIISKYPIIESGKIDFYEPEYSKNGSVYADIQFPDKVVRVYSVHFQSIQWGQGKDFKKSKEKETISGKLARAYKLRVRQMNTLIDHIKASPFPAIIAGDYNEPPLSYINAQLRIKLGMKDAFREAGFGWGSSINSALSLTRIDYVLTDSSFSSNQFHVENLPLSDHLPLTVNISYD
jgi:endonuclease/exonuclease/phosphatase family metal-dependent hydrolase